MEAPKSTSSSGHIRQKGTLTMSSDSRSSQVPAMMNSRPTKAPPPRDCHTFNEPTAMSPIGQ